MAEQEAEDTTHELAEDTPPKQYHPIEGMQQTEQEYFGDLGYDVTRKLGEGDFCPVFHAVCDHRAWVVVPIGKDEVTEGYQFDDMRQCFVKRVSLEGESCAIKRDNSRISRNNEKEVMMVLQHQNIVQIYETMDFNYKYYLIMEYMKGDTTLQDFIKQQTTNLDQFTALLMIRHMMYGLEYLHDKGIAHQDMHDNNLMATVQDNKMVWKLVDFGTATRSDQGGYNPKKDLDHLCTHITKILSKSNVQDDIRNGILTVVNQIKNGRLKRMSDIVKELIPLVSDPNGDVPPEGCAADLFVKTFKGNTDQ